MHRRWKKIGILAGGGNLPRRIVEACRQRDEPFHLVRLQGTGSDALADIPGDDIAMAQAGQLIRAMRSNECDAIVMAGLVSRPDFAALRPDWRALAVIPKLITAAAKGDGALLATLVEVVESEGFIVVGAEEVLGDATPESGLLGNVAPSTDDISDIIRATEIVKAIGPFDIGQGAVVAQTQVLAIEAAEGTDAMLERCVALRGRLNLLKTSGVLVKIPKPGQELRVDLPTVGPRTISLVREAGLNGIALAAGAAIIIDREEMIKLADRAGLFLLGFSENNLDSLEQFPDLHECATENPI